MPYYPKIIKDNLLYYNNDNKLIKTYDLKHEVEINEIAKEIIMLCDGINSIKDITKCIISSHSYCIKLNVVEKDILDLLEILYEFGIISWEKYNPFENKRIIGFKSGYIKEIWFDEISEIDLRGMSKTYRTKEYFSKQNRLKLLSMNRVHEYQIYFRKSEYGKFIISNEIFENIFELEYIEFLNLDIFKSVLTACEYVVSKLLEKRKNYGFIMIRMNSSIESNLNELGYTLSFKDTEENTLIAIKRLKCD